MLLNNCRQKKSPIAIFSKQPVVVNQLMVVSFQSSTDGCLDWFLGKIETGNHRNNLVHLTDGCSEQLIVSKQPVVVNQLMVVSVQSSTDGCLKCFFYTTSG